MIIKEASDRASDIEALMELRSRADASTVKRIDQEIRQIKAGVRGEQEAAYEMKFLMGSSTGRMIIHDLRIEHDGLVAQIDHLIINRILDIWVCESKHFAEGVAVNEHGEFTAFFGGKPYGVPSPIQQNEKHITILTRFLNSGAVKLPTRMGFDIKPSLRSLVLVSKGARIQRPKAKVDGLDAIIKNDNLGPTMEKYVDQLGPLAITRMVGEQTVLEFAKQLASHHRPASFNWAAKFGMDQERMRAKPAGAIESVSAAQDQGTAKGRQCHGCSAEVEMKVARFCWFNKAKFGGHVYCMSCQKSVVAN